MLRTTQQAAQRASSEALRGFIAQRPAGAQGWAKDRQTGSHCRLVGCRHGHGSACQRSTWRHKRGSRRGRSAGTAAQHAAAPAATGRRPAGAAPGNAPACGQGFRPWPPGVMIWPRTPNVKAQGRCAALSRSVQRLKGARLSAGLGILRHHECDYDWYCN